MNLFDTGVFLPTVAYISKFQEEKRERAMLSLKAFREFFSRLHDRFVKLMEIESELCGFDKKGARPLSQIQMDFVDKTEAFHQQVYSTISSFVKLLSIVAPQGFIKKSYIESNQIFILDIEKLVKLSYDITPLKKSLKYRSSYIDHTSQIRHFDWLTYFTGQIAHVIYYEPDQGGNCENITPYIDVGSMKVPVEIKMPVKVKSFFVSPNHAPVYFSLYEFTISLLSYLKINNVLK